MPTVPPSSIALRPLAAHDLPDLLRIQAACYGAAFIESADVYARRLASAANRSLVAERDGRVCAYLAAYHSMLGKVTPLHGDFETCAEPADTLYLHDMAVLPACAGQGLAQALLEWLWSEGRAHGLRHTALVSVQDTQAYWARHGYVPHPPRDVAQHARLASYGAGAVYMARPLQAISTS